MPICKCGLTFHPGDYVVRFPGSNKKELLGEVKQSKWKELVQREMIEVEDSNGVTSWWAASDWTWAE